MSDEQVRAEVRRELQNGATITTREGTPSSPADADAEAADAAEAGAVVAGAAELTGSRR